MTVQYDGGDTYTIHYEHEVYRLPKTLIDELQEFDFICMNDEKSITQLKDKIYDLECLIEDLEDYDMLARENKAMGKYLKGIGLSADEISDIANKRI